MASRTADTLIAPGALSAARAALAQAARKFAAGVTIVIETFAEAKESARIAQERYRFIGE